MAATTSSIHARIQHHPSRVHLLPPLLDSLAPAPTEIITHASSPPSPWAGYQLCLRDPPDCTHLLIVQDDTIPVPGFLPALESIAEANPQTPVVLFVAGNARDAAHDSAKALANGASRYVNLRFRSFLPVVAVLWPRAKALALIEWTDAHPTLPGQREPRSDDAMAGRWKNLCREQIRVCVPSIVEHRTEVPSTIGNEKKGSRHAAFLAGNAMDYDWST